MKVLTFGTFDTLHEGHKAYLRYAQSKGDLYIVVARDVTVKQIKGRLPEQSEDRRVAALQVVFPEADVRLGDASKYLQPIHDIAPDLIVLGYDQQLPPSVSEADLPCPTERAEPFEPETYKSSLLRQKP